MTMADTPRSAKYNISSLISENSKETPPLETNTTTHAKTASTPVSRNNSSRSLIRNLLNPPEPQPKKENTGQPASSSPLSQASSSNTDNSSSCESAPTPSSTPAAAIESKETENSKEKEIGNIGYLEIKKEEKEEKDDVSPLNDDDEHEDEHEEKDNILETASPDKKLACKWEGCSEEFDNAKLLYDHLCDFHVGRKCNKNLTLRCRWDTCRTSTVKRDHITSHLRVHIPLKPYVCETCSKNFKRPQDLKKHTRTHITGSMKDYKCNLLDPATKPDYLKQSYSPYDEMGNKRSFEDMSSSSLSSPLSSCEMNLKRPHFQHSHTEPPFASRYVYKQMLPQSHLYPQHPHQPPPPHQLIAHMSYPPPPPPHPHQFPQGYPNFNFTSPPPPQIHHPQYYSLPPHMQHQQMHPSQQQPPPPPPPIALSQEQQQHQQPIFSAPLPPYPKMQPHPLRHLHTSYTPPTTASPGGGHSNFQQPQQYPGNPGIPLIISPAPPPPPLPQRHDQLLQHPSQLRYIQNYDNHVTKEACNSAPAGQTPNIALAGSSPTTYNTNPVPLSYRRI